MIGVMTSDHVLHFHTDAMKPFANLRTRLQHMRAQRTQREALT